MKNKIAKIPISAKGIVFEDNTVWLRKNERNEWELPGGKLDEDEQPEQAVIRELKEELGFDVEVIRAIHAWVFKVQESKDEADGVLVLSYLCKLLSKSGKFEIKGEAGKAEFRKFKVDDIDNLNMPNFYKTAIRLSVGMSL